MQNFKIDKEEKITFNIELTLKGALWLTAFIQNYYGSNESDDHKRLRGELFDALVNSLGDKWHNT